MDSQSEIETGTKILLSLHAMSSVLKLYDSNNSAVVRQIDSMMDVNVKTNVNANYKIVIGIQTNKTQRL